MELPHEKWITQSYSANTRVEYDKAEKITSMWYKDQKICEQRGSGKWRFLKGKGNAQKGLIQEFNSEFQKAKEKYNKTPAGAIGRQTNVVLEDDKAEKILDEALLKVEGIVNKKILLILILPINILKMQMLFTRMKQGIGKQEKKKFVIL